MNKKGLAILMRTKMRPRSPASSNKFNQMQIALQDGNRVPDQNASNNTEREFEQVQESMRLAISMNKTEIVDAVLNDFSEHMIVGDKAQDNDQEEGSLSAFYRIERNLRHALKPMYEILFERLNTHTGGLKFLSIIRADILSILV
ncbi:unnamed protein product [Ilex paraguariensis]|uniref:Malonyl-CoA decarboxylase N-terminal domain-containing protein n=1 Tax=Ilex paraguariensis TaxID=185542 RepID=A0ABC8R3S4_9AQUA